MTNETWQKVLSGNRPIIGLCVLSLLAIAILFSSTFLSVHAVDPISVTVVDSSGNSHTINDITSLTPTIDWGGYESTQGALNSAEYEGVSLFNLCNSIGASLTSNQNVTVETTGGGGTNTTFNYAQVAEGTSIYPQYSTYNNVTGALQAPTEPVTLIVAYQYANGSSLNEAQSTRLLIVGPQGLLLQGQGLAGVTTIIISNVQPAATTSPSPTSSQSPSTTVSPSVSSSPSSSSSQSPSPTVSPSVSSSPSSSSSPVPSTTPVATGSPQPRSFLMSPENATIIAIFVIIVVVAVGVFLLRKRRWHI